MALRGFLGGVSPLAIDSVISSFNAATGQIDALFGLNDETDTASPSTDLYANISHEVQRQSDGSVLVTLSGLTPAWDPAAYEPDVSFWIMTRVTLPDGTTVVESVPSLYSAPLAARTISPAINSNTLTAPIQLNDGTVVDADSLTLTLKDADDSNAVLLNAQSIPVTGTSIDWYGDYNTSNFLIEITAGGPNGPTVSETLTHNLNLALEDIDFAGLTPTALDTEASDVNLVASSLVSTISYEVTPPNGTARNLIGAANANIVGDDLMAGTFANPVFQTANAANAAGDHSVVMSITGKVVDGSGNFVDGGTLTADSQTVAVAPMIQSVAMTLDTSATSAITPTLAIDANDGSDDVATHPSVQTVTWRLLNDSDVEQDSITVAPSADASSISWIGSGTGIAPVFDLGGYAGSTMKLALTLNAGLTDEVSSEAVEIVVPNILPEITTAQIWDAIRNQVLTRGFEQGVEVGIDNININVPDFGIVTIGVVVISGEILVSIDVSSVTNAQIIDSAGNLVTSTFDVPVSITTTEIWDTIKGDVLDASFPTGSYENIGGIQFTVAGGTINGSVDVLKTASTADVRIANIPTNVVDDAGSTVTEFSVTHTVV